jgi:hypothetical protein
MAQIANTFRVKGLGWKVRKFISRCDTCQRVKYPNRGCAVQNLSHLPIKPGELCAVDFYGPLPVGRFGIRCIFVCFDVFSKFVKLYPLNAATKKACLNKILNDYVVNVTHPKGILSDNDTQFASKNWKNKVAEINIDVMFSPIRHPQANPSERCMREIGTFCRIYCNEAHKKWPELLSHIEAWFNGTLSDSTGYSPVELIFDSPRPDLFEEFLKKGSEQKPLGESLQEKVLKAYVRMKEKAVKQNERGKNSSSEWKPQVGDLVLAKCQAVSDAADSITKKFARPYDGPWSHTSDKPNYI